VKVFVTNVGRDVCKICAFTRSTLKSQNNMTISLNHSGNFRQSNGAGEFELFLLQVVIMLKSFQSTLQNAKIVGGMARAAVKTIKRFTPRMIGPCPLIGQFKVFWDGDDTSVLNILPMGVYRLDYRAEARSKVSIGLSIFFKNF
jgi:hypothetical protein